MKEAVCVSSVLLFSSLFDNAEKKFCFHYQMLERKFVLAFRFWNKSHLGFRYHENL